ncbi:helix-turn-helix domain-containing protein [Natronococcus sp. A-GB1]|uniref:helix-turn-helix domain-containing protein n=1 Tax=Natronococcus sp. A-GB1 TaxID=3037648 RepID=UPI0024203A8E|nr:helix-turn-helix domain-containing protein [Natronococcus sp. A-GB1]MDG5761765.1 helix-turn-helix domain-containing protein [Natronococcus sp. A-GB1]
MATEATFTLPPDEFPLGCVFERFPEVSIHLEQVIPAGEVVVPYFWVKGTTAEVIEDEFTGQPGLQSIRQMDAVQEQRLLRAEWEQAYSGIMQALIDSAVVLINGNGTNEQWTFEIRGNDRSEIADFHQRCQQLDVQFELTALHALTPLNSATEKALTETQQEALMLAYKHGYYRTPREITLEELAVELGITQQAVASRLRRGINQILGETLHELEPKNE